MTIEEKIKIISVLAGSLVIGWLVKRFIFPLLYKFTNKTKWKGDDLVIESISRWVIFWFFLAACLYTLPYLPEILKELISSLDKNFDFTAGDYQLGRNILAAAFIFSLTMVVARIAKGMLQIRSSRDDSVIPTTSILGNIAKIIVYVFGFVLILQTFGVAIAPLLTALGVGGLAVALALQPTLSNLFSGLQIIASGKINLGDFIQLEGGQKGFIRDITWRNTTIETAQGNVIIVPNSKMADSIVENYFLTDRQITFNVLVGVGYESDLDKVELVSIAVAKEMLEKFDGGVKDFEPFVRFYNFGESSIDLKIFLRVKEYADQFLITSEFIKALHKRFNQEGINIPFPIRTVYMNNK
ncbi:MAG: mechanosensitive ion channel [Terrimonas sp.]|nr:mechanosensitive ion channel [Terrimonas sp.]